MVNFYFFRVLGWVLRLDVYLIGEWIVVFFELLIKDRGVINDYIKYFKNYSFYEEVEVIIIYICFIKE